MTLRYAALFIVLIQPTRAFAEITLACDKSQAAGTPVWLHGRLGVYEGGYPNLRLWQIGTNHLFGVYSDRHDFHCARSGNCVSGEAFGTKLPKDVQKLIDEPGDPFDYWIFGNFEVKPLRTYKSGVMQPICVLKAGRLARVKATGK